MTTGEPLVLKKDGRLRRLFRPLRRLIAHIRYVRMRWQMKCYRQITCTDFHSDDKISNTLTFLSCDRGYRVVAAIGPDREGNVRYLLERPAEFDWRDLFSRASDE